MKSVEYSKMNDAEERMWWYRNLHANLAAVFTRYIISTLPAKLDVLDAGSGSGGWLERLHALAPEATLSGIDISERAVEYARGKASDADIRVGSINELPFDDAAFDLITCADVIGAAQVEESTALGEFKRCLKPGGFCVLNLPAYQWMKSYHDEQVGTERRYTRSGVMNLLKGAGFETVYATHWNSTLFPVMVARRLILRNRKNESDVQLMPAAIENLLYGITFIERALIRAGSTVPFGGSVLWVGYSTAISDFHA